jgi:CubicO group peptidase (beta-lactamase class C family)
MAEKDAAYSASRCTISCLTRRMRASLCDASASARPRSGPTSSAPPPSGRLGDAAASFHRQSDRLPSRSCRREPCGGGGGRGCANAAADERGLLVGVGRQDDGSGRGGRVLEPNSPPRPVYIGSVRRISRAPENIILPGHEFRI